MGPMAQLEKKGYVDPAWPEVVGDRHAVTELIAPYAGASSPFGDDVTFPADYKETGYVHPHTRINK